MDLQSSLRNVQSEDADGDNSNRTEPPSPEGSILTFVLFLVQVAVIYAVLRTCIIRCRNIQQRRNIRRNSLEMLSDEADHPFSDDVVVLRNRSKMKHAIRVILDSYTVPFSRRDELLLLQKNSELESVECNETNKGMFRSLNFFSRHKERDHDDTDVEMGIHNEGNSTVEPMDATNKILEPCSKSDVFEEQSELICPICLDEYELNDQVCSKGCNHLYHRDCLEQWLHQKGHKCPYCRKTMISDAELAQHI